MTETIEPVAIDHFVPDREKQGLDLSAEPDLEKVLQSRALGGARRRCRSVKLGPYVY
jgi:hypothetical protein